MENGRKWSREEAVGSGEKGVGKPLPNTALKPINSLYLMFASDCFSNWFPMYGLMEPLSYP